MKVASAIASQYHALEKKYKVILGAFIAMLIVETAVFIALIPFLLKTALFSLILAFWIANFFGYFIARNYLASERAAAYDALIEKFKRGIQSLYPQDTPIELKEKTAQEFLALSDALAPQEQECRKLKNRLFDLIENYPRFSFRLALAHAAKDEITGIIRIDPCAPSAHLALAETKMCLATLYHQNGDVKAFKKLVEEAAEEFKVLVDLSPNEPSLYLNLAYCLNQLEDPAAEKTILEKGKCIAPNHPEILFRLGQLYFSQHETAKGFQIYDSLRRINPSKSEALIAFYK